MFFNTITPKQLFFVKSIFFMPVKLWCNFYNMAYLGHFKKMGILESKYIIYFFRQTLMILHNCILKNGIFTTAFFTNKLFKVKKKKRILDSLQKNSYLIYLFKLSGFFSNFKAVISHKLGVQQRNLQKYGYYFAKRLPSIVFLMSNNNFVKTKKNPFYGQFLRLRFCIFQSLNSNQLFNGIGYCVYINDSSILYDFYHKVCKYNYLSI